MGLDGLLEKLLINFFVVKCIIFLIFDIKLVHFIANKIVLTYYKHSNLRVRIGNMKMGILRDI